MPDLVRVMSKRHKQPRLQSNVQVTGRAVFHVFKHQCTGWLDITNILSILVQL